MSTSQYNKKLILQFYQQIIGQRNIALIDEIIADHYIQHNPDVKTGKDGLIETVSFLKQFPIEKEEEKPAMRLICDGNFVVNYMEISFAGQQKIVVDLFRIENHLIQEHWDAIMDIEDSTYNNVDDYGDVIDVVDQNLTTDNKALISAFAKDIKLDSNYDRINKYVFHDIRLNKGGIQYGISALPDWYDELNYDKIHRIIGEGNFVMTQASGSFKNKPHVIYDIYRIHNNLIQENWVVFQAIPINMAHSNGMI